MDTKNREHRLRYALRKMGYQLIKSRARNWSINDQQGYMIVDSSINAVVGGSDYNYSLEDVAEFVDRC